MDNLNGFFFLRQLCLPPLFFACGFLFGFTLCNRFFDCRFMRFFCAFDRLCFGSGSLGYFFCFSLFVNFFAFQPEFFSIDLLTGLAAVALSVGRFICYFRRNDMFYWKRCLRSNWPVQHAFLLAKAVWRWWWTVKSCCLRHMHYFSVTVFLPPNCLAQERTDGISPQLWVCIHSLEEKMIWNLLLGVMSRDEWVRPRGASLCDIIHVFPCIEYRLSSHKRAQQKKPID